MHKHAQLSRCRKYRYSLSRIWDSTKPKVLFIGLNPSTADAVLDDPTLTRCVNYANSWGYGGVYMANLFAFRATDPKQIKTVNEPVGKENNRWLKNLYQDSTIAIAAWGNDGSYLGRDKEVIAMLPKLYCLKLNRSGQPAHPLYQKASLSPSEFHPG